MTILVPIALIGWIFVAIGLFAVMPPRRAAIIAYLLAWLFLPQASIDLPGMPDLSKANVTSVGVLLGVILFDFSSVLKLRLSWVDLPVLVWCLTSLPAALGNDISPTAGVSPLYDGITGVVKDVLIWGVPYFVGRLYFFEPVALRELALAIFAGGLIYAPLCLFELRMSPCLHLWVYGFHPSSFEMAIRFGGYRPMVFLQHGLMLGMWMTSASLTGIWLWKSGAIQRILNVRVSYLAIGLVVVTVMCKSTGAIALLAFGIATMAWVKRFGGRLALILVAMITPVYMTVRANGLWSGQELIDMSAMISEERADSLRGRLQTEELLRARAEERFWFGWGGWGRWRVHDPVTGKDLTVSDGLWVIARGEKGMVGLVTITALVMLPFVLFLVRVPPGRWLLPWTGAPAALAMLLLLYSIDNLFNAMLNPVYFLGAGGLSGFYLFYPKLKAQVVQSAMARVAAFAPQQASWPGLVEAPHG